MDNRTEPLTTREIEALARRIDRPIVLVGMMGAGLKEGFAQANFEFGAICGLLMLCYFFLPFYRRMGLYTLSEYLGRRFDDRSRLVLALSDDEGTTWKWKRDVEKYRWRKKLEKINQG